MTVPPALSLRREYPILGRRLALASNDPDVIGMADRAFGHWLDLGPALVDAGPPALLTVIVEPHMDGAPQSALPIAHSWVDGHFLSSSDDLRADSDLLRGSGLVHVAPAALKDEARFVHHILEAHALQLLTQRGREPFHAAAVSKEGRAMLLAGPGGVGKSTLCYSLARAGWRLIADDVTFLEDGTPPRVWGNATAIRLLPDARRFFPELAALQPRRLPNGKLKLEAPAPMRAHAGRPCALVVIDGERRAEAVLSPISPAAAIDALFARGAPEFNRYAGAQAAALAMARAGTVARLGPAADPNITAAALTRWFEAEAAEG